MNDLRSRIAAIVDRDRMHRVPGEPGQAVPTETLSTRQGPPGLTAGAPSRGGPRLAPLADGAPRFEVRERRIAIGDLGLEIVGRGACDPLLIAHLGLKGASPDLWQDVLFLDVETTGLSGGTGT